MKSTIIVKEMTPLKMSPLKFLRKKAVVRIHCKDKVSQLLRKVKSSIIKGRVRLQTDVDGIQQDDEEIDNAIPDEASHVSEEDTFILGGYAQFKPVLDFSL